MHPSRTPARTLLLLLSIALGLPAVATAEIVAVGSGSYTTVFPGVDIAGRNGYPSGTPQLTGAAAGRPVPTNDWWSAVVKNDHASNLFNYPLAMRTLAAGLDIGYIVPGSGPNGSSQPLGDISPVVVGVSGLAATRATVDDYSDWTVTLAWSSSGRSFRATTGLAMPFVYFSKGAGDVASVKVNVGTVTVSGEVLLITGSQGGANFAVYAPAGSAWVQAGTTYTSTLAGKNYWSLAFLPTGVTAASWRAHAHVVPVNTAVSWAYDEAAATLRAEYTTTVQVLEGAGTTVLQGLLPHQWAHLAADAPALSGTTFPSIRGTVKVMAANSFATERTFHGILPTLPVPGSGSPGFNPAALHDKIAQLENDSLSTWTDSYNEGQVMNRLIQTARIAHETGDFAARDKMVETVRARLEDWLTAEGGEVAFLFHYQPTWSSLIGYPGGHGQDTNLNDHHFHWGYFIHAASFVEQFQPGWAEQWGDMINLLVRDAASPDRADPLFPFLRSFSPFAGHSWANGFATFPFGNDQESSSESMQFNSSLIHWGAITGNTAIRDLGIFLYTTEQSAIEEYWLDIHQRNFKPGYGFALASRIWGNGYDNQTFWTSDIAAAYGIELYPIHGGSLYLGHNLAYAQRLWAEMAAKTGILSQAVNDNLWHDVYWQFLAFTDPAAAITLYNGNPGRSLKFGVSDAQTYYWLHAMNALGQVDATVTADDPLATVFKRGGVKTYVAHNYSNAPKTITFSDGGSLTVPPRSLATSGDLPFSGTISTPFLHAATGGTVPLTVEVAGDTSTLTGVEFFDGSTSIGTDTTAPYFLQTAPLTAGRHTFSARLNTAGDYAATGLVTVIVGSILPYGGTPIALPGTFEAGAYDWFEGGLGQDVAYHDSSVGNNGDYRTGEYVDAASDTIEGATVGWITGGEWLEYTVQVAAPGRYTLSFRYACGNAAGGGPFHLELDGWRVSADRSVTSTGGWNTWATATLNDVELRAGVHVLRISFTNGELNLGRLTFAYAGPLGYTPPEAVAGADRSISPPASSVTLDGSGSSAPAGGTLSYYWEQVSGPALAHIANPGAVSPLVTGLITEGAYTFRLTVGDGTNEDFDEVGVLVGASIARPPSVSIVNPAAGSQAIAGQPLTVNVAATDPDGVVARVDLYNGAIHLGTLTAAPYSFTWYPPQGAHSLVARAVDNDGLQGFSPPVAITVNAPTPCSGTAVSGDFGYVFSPDSANPTITFVPGRAGVGANIVILYYGTGGGPWPGYIVTPNVPYRMTAPAGQTIRFYYTYSVPEGGERNSSANLISYTIGTCAEPVDPDPAVELAKWRQARFTPADLANPALESTVWGDNADPERDGLPNLLEFYTGSDPLAVSPSPLSWRRDDTTGLLRLRHHRRAGLPASFGVLEWSANLATWSTTGVSSVQVSLADGIHELESTIDALNPPAAGPVFVRIRVAP